MCCAALCRATFTNCLRIILAVCLTAVTPVTVWSVLYCGTFKMVKGVMWGFGSLELLYRKTYVCVKNYCEQ